MLKRLELVGFKSFADKTRFDFASGITAIVGPNGSGKSNVVDAVKWILGEQSAKSLRGGEMADCIFNGSSTRKSLGMAEVTMTFDNTKRQLNFDSDEVQITRRVYRDGQGEYLINSEMSRLKDIKDLFLGSGAGQGAYSIIEQGRVDAMLTSSTSDRRQIFEEAAGISRFKAKKLETLRKLENTEQNLNRVKDILQELEKNLGVLSAQAAKAQKYQEYQTQLRDFRLSQSLDEYRKLTQQRLGEEEALAAIRQLLADVTARTSGAEQQLRQLEIEASRADDGLRHQEDRLAESRQKITEHEAQSRFAREQLGNLETELTRTVRQRLEVNRRIRSLEADLAKAREEAEIATRRVDEETTRAETVRSSLEEVTTILAQLTAQTAADRKMQFQLVGDAARWHSQAEREKGEVDRLTKVLEKSAAERTRTAADAVSLAKMLIDLSENSEGLQQRLSHAQKHQAELQHQQAQLRKQVEAVQAELDEAREKRSALRGQAEVIEELEKQQAGIGAGVKAVLDRAANLPHSLHGLVADLLTTPRMLAPYLDIALGESAQKFVVASEAERDRVVEALGTLPGRVGVIPLKSQAESAYPEIDGALNLTAAVRCQFESLPRQLLGPLFLVDDLATAHRLAASHPQCRFMTRSGELLEPDGSLSIGPTHSDAGLLARKTNLRELRVEIAAREQAITRMEQHQAELRAQADLLATPIADREREIQTLSGEAGELRTRITSQQEQHERLVGFVQVIEQETAATDKELQKAKQEFEHARVEAERFDTQEKELRARIEAVDLQMRAAEELKNQRQQQNTDAQVALGQAKQQLTGLQNRLADWERDLKQRKYDLFNLTADERSSRERQLTAELAALRANQLAAEAYRDKEARQQLAIEWQERRRAIVQHRDQIRTELSSVRQDWEQQHDQAHRHEVALGTLSAKLEELVRRVNEDYSVDITDATLSVPALEEGVNVGQEIDKLKRKLASLGHVNLEAMERLAVEEAREKQIRTEFDDLTTAEQSLLEIIEQINTDSRRMFLETLTTVRTHFQELFRKLFGGGMADIIIENPEDVLESGIEITARPPGKELRSISLLSGGEKTMTAVALLLAIFRSKPSPFCLLDEVDAALDEANTGRLASVLREFLDRSQFIIITHKKRTMSVADVLYGITMQESGISKQVATRLEDWPDEPPQQAA